MFKSQHVSFLFPCTIQKNIVLLQAKSKDIAMKKLPIYQIHRLVCRVSLALCVMLLAGCEVNNVDLTHAHNFVGEYIMNTQIVVTYANSQIETNPYIVESPVSIYVESENVYVQTNCFGLPNVNGTYPIEIEEFTNSTAISNDSNLENTNISSGLYTIVLNGLVYTIRDGIKVKSNPIQVHDIAENILTFRKSRKFEIVLSDLSGISFDKCDLQFEYSPMYKQNELLEWDIDLVWEKSEYIKEIRYHNILRKIE